jgi:hypothetical protein
MEQIQTLLGDRAPVVAAVAVVLAVFYVVSVLIPSDTPSSKHLPLLGGELGNAEQRRKEFNSNARALYEKGYKLFRTSAFRITDDTCESLEGSRRSSTTP